MKITRELLRTWNACYSDDQIAALVPAEGLTPAEVAAKEEVPAMDRIWVLARPEVMGLALWAWLADDVVAPALAAANVTDECCHAVVAMLRRRAGGEVVSEAKAADAAADAAAWAAWAAAAAAAAADAAARAADAAWAAAWAARSAVRAGVSPSEVLAGIARRIGGAS